MARTYRTGHISDMIDDLYSAKILKLAADMPRAGRLPAPDGSSEKIAKLCGSKVTVDVKVEDGQVSVSRTPRPKPPRT